MKASRLLAGGGFVWVVMSLAALVMGWDTASVYVVAAVVMFTGSSLADLIERGRDV